MGCTGSKQKQKLKALVKQDTTDTTTHTTDPVAHSASHSLLNKLANEYSSSNKTITTTTQKQKEKETSMSQTQTSQTLYQDDTHSHSHTDELNAAQCSEDAKIKAIDSGINSQQVGRPDRPKSAAPKNPPLSSNDSEVHSHSQSQFHHISHKHKHSVSYDSSAGAASASFAQLDEEEDSGSEEVPILTAEFAQGNKDDDCKDKESGINKISRKEYVDSVNNLNVNVNVKPKRTISDYADEDLRKTPTTNDSETDQITDFAFVDNENESETENDDTMSEEEFGEEEQVLLQEMEVTNTTTTFISAGVKIEKEKSVKRVGFAMERTAVIERGSAVEDNEDELEKFLASDNFGFEEKEEENESSMANSQSQAVKAMIKKRKSMAPIRPGHVHKLASKFDKPVTFSNSLNSEKELHSLYD